MSVLSAALAGIGRFGMPAGKPILVSMAAGWSPGQRSGRLRQGPIITLTILSRPAAIIPIRPATSLQSCSVS